MHTFKGIMGQMLETMQSFVLEARLINVLMRQWFATPPDERARELGLRLNSEGEAKLRNEVAEKTRLFPERPCCFERGRYSSLFLHFSAESLGSAAAPDLSITPALRTAAFAMFSDGPQDGTAGRTGGGGVEEREGDGRQKQANARPR